VGRVARVFVSTVQGSFDLAKEARSHPIPSDDGDRPRESDACKRAMGRFHRALAGRGPCPAGRKQHALHNNRRTG
jgi:hypothetical protein